jgi:PucR C-terminal helix-turn-helix domain
MPDQPWHELPSEIADVLRPQLEDVAGEMMQAVATVPAYARPLEGPFGDGLRAGVHEALRHLLAEIEAGGAVQRPDVYRALGRGEMRAGRSLESLLSAYRIGARVAWRRFASAGVAAGLEPDTLYLLAESIFAYIDEVSAESVEGYASEQAASAGERQRARQALVRQIVVDGLAGAEAEQAARAVDWQLPRVLAVLAADYRNPERLATLAGEGSVGARVDDLACVLVSDPDAPGRRDRLERRLSGRLAALGPTVAVEGAPLSWTRAARCVRLAQDGVLAADRLVFAQEALGTLALHADAALVDELATRVLVPLEGLTPASRARLEATLLAWLRWQGNVPAAAAELHVHPQTVRYRLARLREHFGDQLDQPDRRFELELALRTQRAGGALGEVTRPARV